MLRGVAVLLLTTVGAAVFAQQPQGKWLNITNEKTGTYIYWGADEKPLIVEDYEVVATHEVCANVAGYFLEKSQLGRYIVRFNGMRTSATFIFTTQYDAEKWAEKWCTPQSLRQIKGGHGVFARNY